jgi:thiol:disulfide interchange protein DsbD
MEWVKSALGILRRPGGSYLRDAFPALRALAASSVQALGPRGAVWGAAVLVAAGILLGAVHRSFGAGSGQALLKGLGIALVAAAVVIRLSALGAGGASGFTWDVRYAGEGTAPVAFDRALAEARAAHRPVMIDFFAEWCAACKELDRETYPSPEVVAAGARFVRIKADGTNATDPMDALYQRFGVNGLPTVAFVSSDGTILDNPRVLGFLDPSKFAEEMRKVR